LLQRKRKLAQPFKKKKQENLPLMIKIEGEEEESPPTVSLKPHQQEEENEKD